MKTLTLLAGSTLALTGAWSAPASAATLLFELTGSRNATFTLETDPVVPDRINNQPVLGGSQIFFDNVAGTFNGVAGTGNINFGSGAIIAALNISAPGLGFTQFGGTDLFSFVNGQPVFNLGSFAFSGFVTGRSTLTISAVEAAVPEPGTWAMMLVAFGLLGAAMRQAKRKPAVAVSRTPERPERKGTSPDRFGAVPFGLGIANVPWGRGHAVLSSPYMTRHGGLAAR